MAICPNMSAVALAGLLLVAVPCLGNQQNYAGTTVHVVFSNHLVMAGGVAGCLLLCACSKLCIVMNLAVTQ